MTSLRSWFRARPLVGGIVAAVIFGLTSLVVNVLVGSGAAYASWREIVLQGAIIAALFWAWLHYDKS
jgi:hypothetical protein